MLIGNDIVDLTQAADKSADFRFLKRVFSVDEISVISKFNQPNKTIWLLWAIKEALYKACQKLSTDYIFSPQKLILPQVVLHGLSKGKQQIQFNYNGQPTLLIIDINEQLDYLHVLAILNWCDTIFPDIRIQKIANIALDYRQQSAEAKRLVLAMSEEKGFMHAQVMRPLLVMEGYQKKGPPQLVINDKPLPVDLSISHDGRYVAVCMQLLFKSVS